MSTKAVDNALSHKFDWLYGKEKLATRTFAHSSPGHSNTIGSLSNHDNDSNKNPINLHI